MAGGPNKESCKNTTFTPGIKMHQFPSDPILRRKWVKFVQRHRLDFAEPVSKYASLCSAHFEENCYSRKVSLQLEGMESQKLNQVLIKGSIPTRVAIIPAGPRAQEKKGKLRYHDVRFRSWHSSQSQGCFPFSFHLLSLQDVKRSS